MKFGARETFGMNYKEMLLKEIVRVAYRHMVPGGKSQNRYMSEFLGIDIGRFQAVMYGQKTMGLQEFVIWSKLCKVRPLGLTWKDLLESSKYTRQRRIRDDSINLKLDAETTYNGILYALQEDPTLIPQDHREPE